MTRNPILERRTADIPRDRDHDLHRADMLTRARGLVCSVAETLNGERSRCEACGLDVLSDLDDGRKLEQLSGIAEKLERLAAAFRGRGR